MADTANLQLPLLDAAQAQKHVTVNDGLLRLDALVQAGVVSATTSVQPASPADGDLYILPPGKTGTHWGPAANEALAHYRDGVWAFYAPREGWLAFARDDDRLLYYTGTQWSGALADLLTALADTGLIVRTGAGAYAARTIQGTANKVNVTNGDGVAGNPTVGLPNPVELGTGRFAGGTATTPGLTPTGDADTGIFAPAADTLAMATGGAEIWRADARGETAATRLRRCLREPSLLWPGMQVSATRTALGGSLSGSAKWSGGVLGQDGNVYGIPNTSADILIVDPVAGTASRSALGASLADAGKWVGGVLGADGKFYGVPHMSPDILIIDPSAGTATRSSMGASMADTTKWIGGVAGPDGKIYGIPANSTTIVIVDPLAGTATRSAMGASLSGSSKWHGGVLGPDGKIYGIPHNSADILIIDPVAGTAIRSNFGLTLTDTGKWYGGALGPDGKIYGIPFNSPDILIIDPVAGTASRSSLGASLSDSTKWIGGTLGPDGRIYGMPQAATDILIIDPLAGTASRASLGASLTGSGKWFGGLMSATGRIVGIPYNSTDILYTSVFAAPFRKEVCVSPYLNTL